LITAIGKSPVCSGCGWQTTNQLPSEPDNPDQVIKDSSSQVSGGTAGPLQQEGSGGGIIPPPPPPMGSVDPGGNPHDCSSDSSDDDDNWRPLRDALAKDWCRYYHRRERKQQVDIQAFFAIGQPKQESSKKCAKHAPPPDSLKGDPKDLRRFMQALDNVFALDSAYYEKDLDRIFYMVSLLQCQAADLFEVVHILIYEDATQAAGVWWDLNSEWLIWFHFRNALSGSFGSWLTSEKVVTE
jgi:hypothetical protein